MKVFSILGSAFFGCLDFVMSEGGHSALELFVLVIIIKLAWCPEQTDIAV